MNLSAKRYARAFENALTVAGVYTGWHTTGLLKLIRRNKPREADTVGTPTTDDWLGTQMQVGSRIVWPCDTRGNNKSKQMAVGTISEMRDDGLTVEVERRSRTGRPKERYDRTVVRLSAVGMAQVTVVG